MTDKIRVYLDKGANIKPIRLVHSHCQFIDFPIDSTDRRNNRQNFINAIPTVTWANWNSNWEECAFHWNDMAPTEKFRRIVDIVGPSNENDAMHLDSAYKSCADVFLTSDERDICSNRARLEKLLGFRIFNPVFEKDDVLAFISCRPYPLLPPALSTQPNVRDQASSQLT